MHIPPPSYHLSGDIDYNPDRIMLRRRAHVQIRGGLKEWKHIWWYTKVGMVDQESDVEEVDKSGGGDDGSVLDSQLLLLAALQQSGLSSN
jgi:hypothetical protein